MKLSNEFFVSLLLLIFFIVYGKFFSKNDFSFVSRSMVYVSAVKNYLISLTPLSLIKKLMILLTPFRIIDLTTPFLLLLSNVLRSNI